MASPADLSPCPVCGDRTNHGSINAVRVLEVLLAAGWRAPEQGAE